MKSHFRFTKQERSGIFFLLLIIAILQVLYLFIGEARSPSSPLAVNTLEQSQIDSLKSISVLPGRSKIYPFNPNFITDFKGYTLGLSTDELDRLYAFRRSGKFVNSSSEFQRVTQVSDSLLKTISPYFKFPEWKKNRSFYPTKTKKQANEIVVLDINKATADELKSVYGIGDKLSARIIKFRDRLGGFLVDDQLYDVYGLEPEVVQRTLQNFKVLKPPVVTQLNINEATVEELARLVYISQGLAQRIITFRETNGPFKSLDDLLEVEMFPKERIDRIKLYLTLKKLNR